MHLVTYQNLLMCGIFLFVYRLGNKKIVKIENNETRNRERGELLVSVPE